MRKKNRLWSFALAGALAVSNLSGVVALPMTTIVAQAAAPLAATVSLNAELEMHTGGKQNVTLVVANDDKLVQGDVLSVEIIGAKSAGTTFDSALTITGATSTPSYVASKELTVGADETASSIDLAVYFTSAAGVRTTTPVLTKTIKIYSSYFVDESIKTSIEETNIGLISTSANPVDITATGTLFNNDAKADLKWFVVSDNDWTTFTTNVNKYKEYKAAAAAIDEKLKTETDSAKIAELTVQRQKLDSDATSGGYATEPANYGTQLAKEIEYQGSTDNITESVVIQKTMNKVITGTSFAQPVQLYTKETGLAAGNYKVVVSEKAGSTNYAVMNLKAEATDADFTAAAIGYMDAKDTFVKASDTGSIATMIPGESLQLYVQYPDGASTKIVTDSAILGKIEWAVANADKDYFTVVKNDKGALLTCIKYDSADNDNRTVTATYVNGNVKTPQTVKIADTVAPVLAVTPDVAQAIDTTGEVKYTALLNDLAKTDVTKSATWKAYTALNNTAEASDYEIKDGVFTASKRGDYFVEAVYPAYTNVNAKAPARLKVTVSDPTIGFEKVWQDTKTATATSTNINGASIGDSFQYKVLLGKTDITKDVEWKSFNTAVATVENGVIKAVGVGSTTVQASYGDSTPKTIVVSVSENSYSIGYVEDGEFTTAGTVGIWSESEKELAVYSGRNKAEGVSWESDNTSYVTVSKDGVIYGIKETKAPVAVIAYDAAGKKIGQIAVTVSDPELNLTKKGETAALPTTITLQQGEKYELTGRYGDTAVSGEWSAYFSAGKGTVSTYVTVNNGVVTANSDGDAGDSYVFFAYGDDEVYQKFEVKAVKALTVTAADTIGEGTTSQVVVKNGEQDVTSDGHITFESSDTSVVRVDDNGVMTGVKADATTPKKVFVKYNGKYVKADGSTAASGVDYTNATPGVLQFEVTVKEKVAATRIVIDPASVTVKAGETATVEAIVTPVGTTDKLVWTSSNEAVATVKDGVITGVSEGSADITVTAGNITQVCKVTVEKADEQKEKEQKEAEQKEQAKKDAVAKASTAAEAAAKDASDANIAALEKAIADAEAAGASDADVKAAKAALTTALKTAKTNADTAKANAEKAKAESDKKAADAATDAANQKKAADAAKAEAEKNQKALDKANAKVATSETIAKLAGKTKKVSGSSYKTDADGGKSVTVTKAKNAKTVTIGKTVKISKNTYKVRSIKAKAFTGKKIRTLKINGANLLFVDNNAFTGTKATKITVTNAKNVKAQLKAAAGAAGLKFKAKGNTVTITKK